MADSPTEPPPFMPAVEGIDWLEKPKRPHAHNNPSPSLGVGAWCNGSQDDPGCGHFVHLAAFTPYRAPYFEEYLGDLRSVRPEIECLREGVRTAARALYAIEVHRQSCGWDDELTARLVAVQHDLAALYNRSAT